MPRKNLEEHLRGNCAEGKKCFWCSKQIFEEEDEHFKCIAKLNEELNEARRQLQEAMQKLNVTTEAELAKEIEKVVRKKCTMCGRVFFAHLLEAHKVNCRVTSSGRPVFDSAAQRLKDLQPELDKLLAYKPTEQA